MNEVKSGEVRALIQIAADELISLEAHPLAPWFERVHAVILTTVPGAADPSVIASHAAARYPGAAWILQGRLEHDFPYNLARRAASVAALGETGIGVLLEPGDAATQFPVEAISDGGAALQKLWQTWPLSTVIGDRATRTFVDASGIRFAHHEGNFSVTGPLQVPVDQHEQPVLLLDLGSLGAPYEVLSGDSERIIETLQRLDSEGLLTPPTGSLRERLGIANPEPLLDAALPAFAPAERW